MTGVQTCALPICRLGKTLKNVPEYISMAQLTEEVLAKAEADIKEQLKSEGKPEKIWDKIVPGKLERYIADNTTLDHGSEERRVGKECKSRWSP